MKHKILINKPSILTFEYHTDIRMQPIVSMQLSSVHDINRIILINEIILRSFRNS